MKVLIFGGTGLLGSDIIRACIKDYDITGLNSKDINVTDMEAVYKKVKEVKPDCVINSAAITDVDKCEKNADMAYTVNALGPKNIAIACRDTGAKMMQISTDYVFDGTKNEPYIEFDKTNPVNTYGKTKLAGEEMVK